MSSFVQKAMVWLGISDDDEELDVPVYQGEHRRAEWDGSSSGSYGEPEPSREHSEPSGNPRVQLVSSANDPSVRDQPTQQFQPPSFTTSQVEAERRSEPRMQVIRSIQPERPKVHLALPTRFSDVQEIGDRMKADQPVIVNLENVDRELYRRIVDFCSGLTYALGGKVKKVGEQVFLLTPSKVQVADEEMERITERAVFRGNGR